MRYTNEDTYVAFRWQLVDINKDTIVHGTTLDSCQSCSAFYRVIVAKNRGRVRVALFHGADIIACQGLQRTWSCKTNVITARVPKLCIYGPGSLVTQGYTSDGPLNVDAKYDLAPGRDVERS